MDCRTRQAYQSRGADQEIYQGRDCGASAPSRLEFGVAELARVQVFGILANSATPKSRFEEALAPGPRQRGVALADAIGGDRAVQVRRANPLAANLKNLTQLQQILLL